MSVFTPEYSSAQSGVVVGVRAGYADFKLTDIRSYQRYDFYTQHGPVEIPYKINQSFPSFVNISGEVLLRRSKYFWGVMASHSSTGGRMTYSDYSGSAYRNMLVTMNETGFIGGYKIFGFSHLGLFAGTQAMYAVSDVHVTTHVEAGPSGESSDTRYYAHAYALQPFVELQYTISRVLLKAHAGYEYYYSKSPAVQQWSYAPPLTYNSNSVTIDPTGIRLDFGIGVIID